MAGRDDPGKRVPRQDGSFDPYAMLGALDRHRVSYVVIGAFARVVHGTAEVTDGLDITPSMRQENVSRLEKALRDLEAEPRDGKPLDLSEARQGVFEFSTQAGELKVVPAPAGSRGYDDLRRHASRESLGRGLRPQVASVTDLARMLGALGRDDDQQRLLRLRRLIELERGRGLGLEL